VVVMVVNSSGSGRKVRYLYAVTAAWQLELL
jgi:hypothetical protein